MNRRIIFTLMITMLVIPGILLAGWDWPAGPGTSMTKLTDVDNDNTCRSTPGQKIVYNPDNYRVQIVYIPDFTNFPNSRLMYAYSQDDGESFTTLGPIDNGQYVRNTALATDANDVPYMVWCEYNGPPEAADSSLTVAIYFAKDEEFGAGLFESQLVSDPNQVDYTMYGYPSIVVSPDGQNIVISWHTSKPADQLQPYGILVVTSNDGGQTFSSPVEVVKPTDLPSNNPLLSKVESPTMTIGEDGYVFLLFNFYADSLDGYDRRPAFVESFDYGSTWSTPEAVPLNPDGGAHGHSWYQTYGPPILVDGEPHFIWICKAGNTFPPGSVAVWHFGREGASWTSTRVCPEYDEEDMFFENSNFASIAKDADNNIYVCYLTTSIAAGYNWGMVGLQVSSDNGLTWDNEYPLPMHDYVADTENYIRMSMPNIAQNVGANKLHVLAMEGGYWSGPAKAVWVLHADPKEIADYEAPEKADFPPVVDGVYNFDDTVPFNWIEINEIGTKIDRSEWVVDADDGSVGPIDMGMDFDFYGNMFNSCYIGVNGQVSFTDPMVLVAPAEGGATIPGIAYDNLLCVFAGDLNNGAYPNPPYSSKSGTVYYYGDPDNGKFIVEWENLNNHVYIQNNLCVDTTITFQVVLDKFNKSITCNYKDVGIGDYGRGSIIGIQPSKDDTLGVQYYGGGFPRDGYPGNESTVKFYQVGSRIVDEYYDLDDSVPFEWTEINQTGTKINRSEWVSRWVAPDADDGAVRVPINIDFEFYGSTFDSITIGINGIMSFTDWSDWIEGPEQTGTTIPGIGYDNVLCVFTADLLNGQYPDAPYLSRSGSVFYQTDTENNKFIVEWENMNNHHYVVDNACVDTSITFQAVLDGNDNSITFYYKDIGIADPLFAVRSTIGIQPSMEGTLGVQYYGGESPSGGYPTNETAVRIYQRTSTSVETAVVTKPLNYQLEQNYPNPFNPTTTIQFSTKEIGLVELTVYNMLGQKVATLLNKTMEAGYHQVQWNAVNSSGQQVPSGIYFYKIQVHNAFSQTKKMILLK